MKVAITGHTRGLGKGLYDALLEQGHEVLGFSLSTGYNINTPEGANKIVEESKDVDLFINNAFSLNADTEEITNWETIPTNLTKYNGQVELLKLLKVIWKDTPNKFIINLGSRMVLRNPQGMPFLKLYRKTKELADIECNVDTPNICNIHAGLFDTDLTKDWPEGWYKSPVKDYVDYILKIIELKDNVWIKYILLNPPLGSGKVSIPEKLVTNYIGKVDAVGQNIIQYLTAKDYDVSVNASFSEKHDMVVYNHDKYSPEILEKYLDFWQQDMLKYVLSIDCDKSMYVKLKNNSVTQDINTCALKENTIIDADIKTKFIQFVIDMRTKLYPDVVEIGSKT